MWGGAGWGVITHSRALQFFHVEQMMCKYLGSQSWSSGIPEFLQEAIDSNPFSQVSPGSSLRERACDTLTILGSEYTGSSLCKFWMLGPECQGLPLSSLTVLDKVLRAAGMWGIGKPSWLPVFFKT